MQAPMDEESSEGAFIMSGSDITVTTSVRKEQPYVEQNLRVQKTECAEQENGTIWCRLW